MDFRGFSSYPVEEIGKVEPLTGEEVKELNHVRHHLNRLLDGSTIERSILVRRLKATMNKCAADARVDRTKDCVRVAAGRMADRVKDLMGLVEVHSFEAEGVLRGLVKDELQRMRTGGGV